jgi:hypothetical protein
MCPMSYQAAPPQAEGLFTSARRRRSVHGLARQQVGRSVPRPTTAGTTPWSFGVSCAKLVASERCATSPVNTDAARCRRPWQRSSPWAAAACRSRAIRSALAAEHPARHRSSAHPRWEGHRARRRHRLFHRSQRRRRAPSYRRSRTRSKKNAATPTIPSASQSRTTEAGT